MSVKGGWQELAARGWGKGLAGVIAVSDGHTGAKLRDEASRVKFILTKRNAMMGNDHFELASWPACLIACVWMTCGIPTALPSVAADEFAASDEVASTAKSPAIIDRTTMLVPLDDGPAPLAPSSSTSVGPTMTASQAASATVLYPDEACGEYRMPGWQQYMRVWKAHHADPSSIPIRRMLGLPIGQAPKWSAKRGRSAPTWLDWKPGTYAEIETPHFMVHSQAGRDVSFSVVEDLQRCYWIWTQLFFPVWEASDQVTAILGELSSDDSVARYLENHSGRISIKRKLRVVLFRDSNEYARALARDVPGIERSTGFYSDARKTMCLYASDSGDAATRRHELVHQLFREATRSSLGRSMPGEQSGFWLIEGIAGYFESLHVDDSIATVGGWDSPRLQFGRYRTLVSGDHMSIDELQSDGRMAAQKRDDIARWYAHAITQTHRLMDGGNPSDRMWVYQTLAEMYRVKTDLPDTHPSAPSDDEAMRNFLAIDDATLLGNPPLRKLESLCLADCRVTMRGMQSIGDQSGLSWLDLARLPIGNDAVERLVPSPDRLEQLTLEGTRIDSGLAPFIRRAHQLREVDLSWTKSDDRIIEALKAADEISVLWMTGTQISDASVAPIAAMKDLVNVDVQRTEISDDGIAKLRRATSANVNPLELRTSTP